MRTKEYEERNSKGYEGDTFIHGELKSLIDKHGVKVIVETGTYHGFTTLRLSEFGLKTLTVECDRNNYDIAIKNIAGKAYIHFGDSVKFLNHVVKTIEQTSLFYLDAHWGNVCPLLQELKELETLKNKPVIAIHDFKTDNPDHGYDSYNGQEFTYEWIKPSLDNIYGEGQYKYHYNKEADGAKRGVIYIYPVKKPGRKKKVDTI